ncbi:uncharacterized protein LOC130689217 [Daphnia carinata]|uniref:uncharacterized protein LOC130689217 n=1 Tax=Daphnia carinata TaxID=120202 RepID=UPI00257CA2C1|nr:uncharacterized protein LOC130689217 [Daphnia carinata]
MNYFTFHLASLLGVIILKFVSASPYGFASGRQEDAIVIDAAPSFSPVPSDSDYAEHDPVYCRHRIHYNPSSYSSDTSTRQNYQQQEPVIYQPFNNPAVVRMRQYPSSNSYETYRTPSSASSSSYETKYETYRTPSVPSSSSYETKYETYRAPSASSSNSYETKYETYRAPSVSSSNSYGTKYETHRAPSATVESPAYFQRQNNDIQQSSQINKHDYGQTGSSYEAFMVQQGSARMVMGYRLVTSTSPKPKLPSSYY